MADRDLKIEVHYEDHGAQQAVQKLDSSLEGVGTTAQQTAKGGLSQMSGLMKGALVGAAVSAAYAATEFVGELMAMSEEAVRVADRTGLTTRAVQQLGYIATQSGNSLDQITTALGQMQNRIASGDKSAVAAVQALGLNLGEIRDLSADEQFYAIGQAVASIEDPMTRTQLAMDLFGRSGAAVLPTLIADMEKLRDEAPVMADALVRDLERAGDTLDRLSLTAKVAGANILGAMMSWAKMQTGVKSLFEANEYLESSKRFAELIKKEEEGVARSFDASSRAAGALTMSMEDADRVAKALTKSVPHLGRVSGETAAEVWTLAEALRTLRGQTDRSTLAFTTLDGVLGQVGPQVGATATQFEFLGWAMDPIVGRQLPEMIALLPKAAQEAAAATGPTTGFFSGVKKGAAGLVDGLTGGQGLSGFFSNIGFGITQQLGSILTGGLNSLIDKGLQIAWAGVKKLGSVLGGLFGGGEYGDVKDARKAYEQSLGGVDALIQKVSDAFAILGKRGDEAEQALKNFWNAKDLQSYEAALRVLQDAFAAAGLAGTTAAAQTATAFGHAADAASAALRDIPDSLHVKVHGEVVYDDARGYPVPEAHTGGYIDPRGRVLHYAQGGEVPAILHSGEYVVRRQAVDALGIGTLQHLNRTGRMPSAAAPITVTINNPDIDNSVGLDRFTRRLELALDRAARRARAA